MDERTVKNKSAAKYIAPVDEAELACRMYEAVNGVKRPPGITAEQALDTIQNREIVIDLLKSARAAMKYWAEYIQTANRTN